MLPFQIRGSLQTILTLRLLAPDDPEFFSKLTEKIAHAPDFYRDAPVVIDVGRLAVPDQVDLADFVERLRQYRLVPVGVQGGNEDWREAVAAADLAWFGQASRDAATDAGSKSPGAERATSSAASAPEAGGGTSAGRSMTLRETVRGGQQVVNPAGDLVVLGAVSDGAEVAAAGHVHIYGALRGRAFAGIGGDQAALIFCDQLQAGLVSIAGIYLVNEDLEPSSINRRVRIHSDGERLVITRTT